MAQIPNNIFQKMGWCYTFSRQNDRSLTSSSKYQSECGFCDDLLVIHHICAAIDYRRPKETFLEQQLENTSISETIIPLVVICYFSDLALMKCFSGCVVFGTFCVCEASKLQSDMKFTSNFQIKPNKDSEVNINNCYKLGMASQVALSSSCSASCLKIHGLDEGHILIMQITELNMLLLLCLVSRRGFSILSVVFLVLSYSLQIGSGNYMSSPGCPVRYCGLCERSGVQSVT